MRFLEDQKRNRGGMKQRLSLGGGSEEGKGKVGGSYKRRRIKDQGQNEKTWLSERQRWKAREEKKEDK